ncbi:hypothetical protein TNIN_454791 [Trichonephila inaurata madagascariensis]|uniref:Uncharacterized protein n=1 Tax=Trichonephila inaurata madagascariensis TaxID=2747483 RepID=A0A8X6X1J3_9ARAC|nr:hypothetical protein TNIN_454791 [Trichonephila inaurata madagascariensis]
MKIIHPSPRKSQSRFQFSTTPREGQSGQTLSKSFGPRPRGWPSIHKDPFHPPTNPLSESLSRGIYHSTTSRGIWHKSSLLPLSPSQRRNYGRGTMPPFSVLITSIHRKMPPPSLLVLRPNDALAEVGIDLTQSPFSFRQANSPPVSTSPDIPALARKKFSTRR